MIGGLDVRLAALVLVLGLFVTACATGVVSSDSQQGSENEAVQVAPTTSSTGAESASIGESSDSPADRSSVTELTVPAGTTFVRPSPASDYGPTTTTLPRVATDTSTEKVAPVSASLMPIVDSARQDLSGRLGVAENSIATVLAEFVTWPDSSLGCPRPGMSYLQVLTDGARIRLQAGGAVYEYHSGPTGVPFLCESSLFQAPTPPGSADS